MPAAVFCPQSSHLAPITASNAVPHEMPQKQRTGLQLHLIPSLITHHPQFPATPWPRGTFRAASASAYRHIGQSSTVVLTPIPHECCDRTPRICIETYQDDCANMKSTVSNNKGTLAQAHKHELGRMLTPAPRIALSLQLPAGDRHGASPRPNQATSSSRGTCHDTCSSSCSSSCSSTSV